MQFIAEEGCADSSLQAKWGSVQQEVSFAKAPGVLPLGHRASNCLGNRLSGGNMGGWWWWKGVQVQRKGKAGNCKQQGASKQVAGKGEGAEKVVYSQDIGTKMLKIATTGQIEACFAD